MIRSQLFLRQCSFSVNKVLRRHIKTNPEYTKHAEFIRANTEVTSEHLTPEIPLHLITPSTPLWTSREGECPVPDPFWGFYWPGGQALSRYILDNPSLVRGKRVLDVGSGCGASAIAAVKAGASVVTANDICDVAIAAIALNANVNEIELRLTTRDLIGLPLPKVDVVLLGDMFYDTDFATTIASWLSELQARGICVIVGDPGRLSFMMHPIKRKLQFLATYDLPKSACDEKNGLTEGFVWGSNVS